MPFLRLKKIFIKKGKIAGNNPWEGLTPEWLTTSPPPVENWKGDAPLVSDPYGYGKDYLS